MFPTVFPKQALAELLALAVSPDKPSASSVALASYEVLGFVLNKLYPGAALPVGSLNLSQLEQLLSLPAVQNLPEVLSTYESLVASGKTKLQAFFALVLQYGPSVAELVLQVLALTGA